VKNYFTRKLISNEKSKKMILFLTIGFALTSESLRS